MIACTNPSCTNKSDVLAGHNSRHYRACGQDKYGLKRYKCNECNVVFTHRDIIVNDINYNAYTNIVLWMLLSGRSDDRICDEINIDIIQFHSQVDFITDNMLLFERCMSVGLTKNSFKNCVSVITCDGLISIYIDASSGYIIHMTACPRQNAFNSIKHEILASHYIKLAKRKMHHLVDYLEHPTLCNQAITVKMFQIFRIYYNYSVLVNGEQSPAMGAGIASKPVNFRELFKVKS